MKDYLQDKQLENKLLKTKPRYLHKKKLQMVFEELQKIRRVNYEKANAFENESLKINFQHKSTISSSFWSYFY